MTGGTAPQLAGLPGDMAESRRLQVMGSRRGRTTLVRSGNRNGRGDAGRRRPRQVAESARHSRGEKLRRAPSPQCLFLRPPHVAFLSCPVGTPAQRDHISVSIAASLSDDSSITRSVARPVTDARCQQEPPAADRPHQPQAERGSVRSSARSGLVIPLALPGQRKLAFCNLNLRSSDRTRDRPRLCEKNEPQIGRPH